MHNHGKNLSDADVLEMLVRDNPEFDEKLPELARQIADSPDIRYDSEEESDVLKIVQILRNALNSFADLTYDEVLFYITQLRFAAAFIELERDGLIEKHIRPDGQEDYQSVVERESSLDYKKKKKLCTATKIQDTWQCPFCSFATNDMDFCVEHISQCCKEN